MRRLRSQFALLFCLLAVLPILILGGLTYRVGVVSLRQDAERQLIAERDKKAELVEAWLKERLSDIRVAAESVALSDYLSSPTQQRVSVARRWLSHFMEINEPGAYQRAYVVHAGTGRIAASSHPRLEGQAPPQRLKPILGQQQPVYVGEPFLTGRPDGEPAEAHLDIAAPVIGPGGQRLGTLVAESDLTHALMPALLGRTGLGRTGEVVLVDREGMPLTPLRGEGGVVRLRLRTEPAVLAARGGRGLIRATNYQGTPVLAAYTGIPVSGWGLVVEEDLSELEAPVTEFRWMLISILGFSTVVAAGLALWLAGRLTRPLAALSEATQRLARGEPEVRVEPLGPREMEAAAQAFNAMAAELDRGRREQEDTHRRIELLAGQAERRAEWLAAILEQIPAGVVIASEDGRIVLANPAAERIWGPGIASVPAELYERYWRFLDAAGEPLPAERLPLMRAIRQGETVTGEELTLIRPGDLQVPLVYNALPLKEAGRPSGAVVVFWDISDLKAAQRRLEEAGRLKDEFLSLATHELKTPVTSIKIFSELALRRPETVQPKLMETLLRQADQLVSLVNDLLDVSRFQMGRMPMETRRLDLGALVRELIQRPCPRLLPRLKLRLPEEPVWVEGDPVRLEQVFNNLLDNAVKYSPEGGPIELRLRVREGWARAEVQDQGVGIAPEHLPHVFERFYKPGPQEAAYTGLGVGLYICREIVDRHGGRIWAESEPGKGSTFFVELPLSGEERPWAIP